ncbi:SCPU domain-containing protein [Paracidovorax avenae]|uniref:Csu type fimbrial protein n=1 Tax=Paracidovorax avenae TaxID=80867 RepID=UPI000D169325|nr:spore coat U domain-containing protein [Paracidovorax avenae]AVS72209.1 SCPU domain-containing protein [Paracidovorax avenae]AVS79340.1 SCPU domain-containing protein [Paracidovorax avenae]
MEATSTHPAPRQGRIAGRKARPLAAAAVLALAAGAAPLGAATLSGVLGARMMLTSGCVINGGPGTVSGADFGTLDFGSRPATFVGTATATASGGEGGAGATQIVCSPEITAFSITIDSGTHAGQGAGIGTGTRAMSNGSAFLPYDVYRDPGHTVPYTAATAVTGIAVPSAGNPFTLPIYGLVNKTNAVALPAGLYTDQLQVTLTF